MSSRVENTNFGNGQRLRRRLRRACTGKTGKTVGLMSIAAPVIGYVINDIKKPDSVIRGLIETTVTKLLSAKQKAQKAIDVTNRVEIIEDKSSISQ